MRLLLSAAYSVIEPLGLLHLAGLARDLNWETKFSLIEKYNYSRLYEDIKDFKPNVIGFNIYTGNHIQTFNFIQKIKQDFPGILIVVGGPHPTYFPIESNKYADFVVMSEGFHVFKKILLGEVQKGIYPLFKVENFPLPDREQLYKDYPEYGRSKIKSIIGMTGCPYRCTYCYNSSSPKDIKVTPELAEQISKALGMSGRLFPYNVRSVKDIIIEAENLRKNWDTDVIYFQDDVHGFDIKEWLPELAKEWKEKVKIPYHAQMRWEMTHGESGKKRLDIIKSAGCFGLTLAIESAIPEVRKEVLDRATDDSVMFQGMKEVVSRGLKVRTEQITALPYGATTEKTIINLDADLSLIELNVKLKKETGGPDMAWASTFAPYAGTKLGIYCQDFGFYNNLDNYDVPDTFFDKSILKFLKEWVGTELVSKKENNSLWLDEQQLEKYRTQNAALRRYFNMFCLVPNGHILAKEFLTNNFDYSPSSLNKHIYDHSINNDDCKFIVTGVRDLSDNIHNTENLYYYFSCIPKKELLIDRYNKYMNQKNTSEVLALSTATRHHLYDEVLYSKG